VARVVNTETAGKDRTRLSKSIVLALRELMRQSDPDDQSRDLAAFIVLALLDIYKTVDLSVTAWEKKGYWIKADRFRLDWEWTGQLGEKMRTAVLVGDWATIAVISAQVAQKFMKVQVPVRNRLGTPWVGAWEALNAQK
jgi:hypothetical protein